MANKSLSACPKCGKKLPIRIPTSECTGIISKGFWIGYDLKPTHKTKAECIYVKCLQPLWIHRTGRITKRNIKKDSKDV